MIREFSLAFLLIGSATAATAIDSPLEIADRSQLMAEKTLVQSSRNVAFTLHPAKKHSSNPILKADRPWEGWRISLYGTVLFDPDERLFKMWYTSDVSEDFPNYAVLYATSRDGISWEKPLVGTIAGKKSAAHNGVLAEGHLPSVIRDPAETNPERRYKMLSYIHLPKPQGGPHVFGSPDGLKWTQISHEPICRSNDVITAFFQSGQQRYVAIPKLSTMVRGQVRRCFGLSTSEDFERWTEPRYILRPDLQDDAGSLKRIEEVRSQLDVPDDPNLMRTEFYGVGVYQAESCIVGFPWVFTINNNARFGNHEGPSEVQLAVTRDLDQWDRQFREPILPHGKPGEWDSGFLASSSEAIRVGDEIRLYYSGANYTHGTPCLYREEGTGRGTKYTAGIGLATWKLDRFVSADGPKEGGVLTTVPVAFTGDRMEVNFVANPGGSVIVELLDMEGTILAASKPLQGDELRGTVNWTTGSITTSIIGKPIQVRFSLRDAQLFSFAFRR